MEIKEILELVKKGDLETLTVRLSEIRKIELLQ